MLLDRLDAKMECLHHAPPIIKPIVSYGVATPTTTL